MTDKLFPLEIKFRFFERLYHKEKFINTWSQLLSWLHLYLKRIKYSKLFYVPFEGEDVILCLNLMFDALKIYDKINHFSILSWLVFIIFILSIGQVTEIRNYPNRIINLFLIYYNDILSFFKYCHYLLIYN